MDSRKKLRNNGTKPDRCTNTNFPLTKSILRSPAGG
jgi:hypothetical protein